MKERITYIDAMRGLAIFMVVSGHVCMGSFYHIPVFAEVINYSLQIPLFFMISGFFAPTVLKGTISRNLWQKFVYLVIPAILMLGIYCFIMNEDFVELLFKPMKGGYWFTIVLFCFIAIYSIISSLLNKIRLSEAKSIISHICTAILISYMSLTLGKLGGRTLGLLSAGEYFGYTYFIVGMILFKYRDKLFEYMNISGLSGGVVVFYIIYECLHIKYDLRDLSFLGPIFTISGTISGLLVIWQLFRTYPALSIDSKVGRFLTLMGRRSLDIYFLHYFFLPRLSSWGKYFESINDAPIIEYTCAIVIAIVLVYASLGVSYILRLSPITTKVLLGDQK